MQNSDYYLVSPIGFIRFVTPSQRRQFVPMIRKPARPIGTASQMILDALLRRNL